MLFCPIAVGFIRWGYWALLEFCVVLFGHKSETSKNPSNLFILIASTFVVFILILLNKVSTFDSGKLHIWSSSHWIPQSSSFYFPYDTDLVNSYLFVLLGETKALIFRHWGSGLSSRAVETEGEVGSSSEPSPPSKKVPEKSRACDFTTSAQNFCASFFCPSHTFSQILIHLLFFPSHPQILTLRSSDLLSNGRSWRRRVR